MANEKKSLFQELKRRNVFRVAIAYIGIAWLLVQVADVFFPALNLPDWTVTFVAGTLILGLPVAIFLAWAYDMTPEGLKRDSEVSPAQAADTGGRRSVDFLVIGILGIAVAWFVLDKTIWSGDPATTAQDIEQTIDQTIAVLPFTNISPDEQGYLADGLTEELLNLLTRVTDLRVVGRTSSFKFKDQSEDLREIGRQLGAGYLLAGSVRKYGEEVRVSAQLIDASNGVQIWSESFERQFGDIFMIQDAIARSVVAALQVEFLGVNRDDQPFDPRAYDLYLKGLRLSQLSSQEDTQQALDYLQQAVDIDPTLAQAWVTLASLYTRRTVFWAMPPEVGIQRINEAVDKALAADPESADAHATLGYSRMTFSLDWQGAEEAYTRALAIDPNHPGALRALGTLAAARGEIDEALTLTKRVQQLDPLNLVHWHNLAFLHYLNRDYDRAEVAFLEALNFAGVAYSGGYMMLSLTLVAAERPADAVEAALKEELEPMRLGGLALAYHALGEEELAEEFFTEFREKYGGRAAVPIAGNYAQRGDLDSAFEWLERAYQQRDAQLLWTLSHPVNDTLRADPRFDALIEKLKLRRSPEPAK